MKMLTVCALLCAMMALATAQSPPDAKSQIDKSSKADLVKRSACPYGWTRIFRRCFRYMSTPKRWARAEQHCQRLGGNLASIHSPKQYRKTQAMISSLTRRTVGLWIGGSDAQEEKTWLWSDGKEFKYENWCPGQPNNQRDKQHCLAMNYSVYDFTREEGSLQSSLPALLSVSTISVSIFIIIFTVKMLSVSLLVCAMMASIRDAEATTGNNSCGTWTEIKDRCFHFVPTLMKWAKAEKNCQVMGANLASIRSIEEYHEIQLMVKTKTHYQKPVWVGGFDAPQSGVWLWSDGSTFQFTLWCPGQPSSWWSQHCLQINYGEGKCWDNTKCNTRLPSICTKKP
ncbi:C-type mannose receptor 2-like [Scomber japonicus]|uniref:C-type mannose receptor 2-like n=1 Tax=Scomber japonicus TaxID=13676 RepID=UPI002304FB7F|nr:C-type mannose receptor 2-like [Scomber japonicus]